MTICTVCNCPTRRHATMFPGWEYGYCSVKCRDKDWGPRINRVLLIIHGCPPVIRTQLLSVFSGEFPEVMQEAARRFKDVHA